jgi:hypothetical protein
MNQPTGQGNAIRETWGLAPLRLLCRLSRLFIGTTTVVFNDGIAEAAGFFEFPCYLGGMTEVL